MDAAEMVGRVLERGRDAAERVESDTAESLIHQRLKRVRWFQEWLESEVARMGSSQAEMSPEMEKEMQTDE
jgi:uncharacterized protein